MAKFKVGDRIRSLEEDVDITKGGAYTVTGASGCWINFIDDDGDERDRNENDYELVEDVKVHSASSVRGYMTQEEFLKALEAVYKRNVDISRSKNSDYAGTKDAFKNFTVIEGLTNGEVSTEEGILVRMTDKMQRISNLLYSENKVKDEAITDTLADLCNYAAILKVYIENKNERTS